ncbi:hypothetical protein HNR39_002095 [Glaciimonas immobilis]|uniref:Uncharacterized protein n=1 Tax=Glaciimonas immobilis TaxID=728004 RepID=A0A840RUR5_9BURK|nr:hypothetical protein [Glaciimonas immobilis]
MFLHSTSVLLHPADKNKDVRRCGGEPFDVLLSCNLVR